MRDDFPPVGGVLLRPLLGQLSEEFAKHIKTNIIMIVAHNQTADLLLLTLVDHWRLQLVHVLKETTTEGGLTTGSD